MAVWHRSPDDAQSDSMAMPRFTRTGMTSVPKDVMPDGLMLPQTAYEIVRDEVMLDGNARFNLATFVTTWMDSEADDLYRATFDKNMIDKDEYPQTAEIESRCVRMLASSGTHRTGQHRRDIDDRQLRGMHARRTGAQETLAEQAPRGGKVDRATEHRHGRQRPGRVGEVRELLGGRAALRAARGRRLPPDHRPSRRLHRREHDRRRRCARLDDGRHLRAGAGDLRVP